MDPVSPRAALRHFLPYVAGASLEAVRERFHLRRVVKLASNENALGPSPRALSVLKKAAGRMNRYPDGTLFRLRRVLSQRLSVSPRQLFFGSGSDEIIELLGKAYLNGGDEIVVSQNAFVRYAMAGHLMGARVKAVPMKNMRHDLDGMLKAISHRTKLIFVANPNNPTGTYADREETSRFLRRLPARVLAVFDEAYYEYARLRPDYPELLPFARRAKNLILLRTFSKVYGLAGLRIGFAVGPDWVFRVLEKIRPPFNVNSLAPEAALAALSDRAHIRRTLALTREGLNYLQRELLRLGLPYVPTAGNFLLIRVGQNGAKLAGRLLRRGVIVRAVAEYGFPDCIRVTVGLPEENRFFIKTLREVR